MQASRSSAPIKITLSLTQADLEQLRDTLGLNDLLARLATHANRAAAPPPLAYTVATLAKATDRTPWYIRDQIRKGLLKATRPGGGDTMITPEHAAEWLAAGEV
jgi:hypothetical protein